MDKTKRIDRYQSAYVGSYGFESTMVKYRQRLLLDRLAKIQPAIIVEIGCGTDLLYKHFLKHATPARQWLIVEPSTDFHRIAVDSGLPNLSAVCGFFEENLDQVAEQLSAPPDMILLSSVLHEVPSPSELLGAIHGIMGEQSLLHANVPNAGSLHRLLAMSMGLISDTRSLSSRNIELLQQRVYDARHLRDELESLNFVVVEEGGYFVKPFTHRQMQAITPVLSDEILDGLYELGRQQPQIASEIYIEARRV